jgi:hypothetical protein
MQIIPTLFPSCQGLLIAIKTVLNSAILQVKLALALTRIQIKLIYKFLYVFLEHKLGHRFPYDLRPKKSFSKNETEKKGQKITTDLPEALQGYRSQKVVARRFSF